MRCISTPHAALSITAGSARSLAGRGGGRSGGSRAGGRIRGVIFDDSDDDSNDGGASDYENADGAGPARLQALRDLAGACVLAERVPA